VTSVLVDTSTDAGAETPNAPTSRREKPREFLFTLGVFAIYAGLALAAYWPILPGDTSRMPTCACGDPSFQTWLLGWIPFALGHGQNPFFSSWTNYPWGVNLAQNTNMPLLGLIAAPITVTLGPIASYNLLLWLSFPVSAISMYWVTRRWTGSRWAALVAGFIYGFSAYIVGQAVGHVMFSFVPLPPLYFYQLHKLVVRREGRPYLNGALLGLIAVAQFFISSEVTASLILLSVIALVIYGAVEFRSITRSDIIYVLKGLLAAAGLTIACVAYPLWFVLRGPQHFAEPVRPFNNVYHGVGLGAFLPTLGQRFGLAALDKYGHQLSFVENGQYLGIPLVVLTGLFVVWYRRNRALLLAVTLALIAYILTLGTHTGWLHLNGSTPLPFTLLGRIPLVNNLIAERLSLYPVLFVAIAVAFGVAELIRPVPNGPQHLSRSSSRRVLLTRRGTAVVIGVLAVVTLIPAWPYGSAPSNVPHFFLSNQVERIPRNSVVLTYPFPNYPMNQALTWQSVSGMRFKEVGTYAFVRGPNGKAITSAPYLAPAAVQHYLLYLQLPAGHYPYEPYNQALVADVRSYVSRWNVRAVIVSLTDGTVRNVPAAVNLFTQALGPPTEVGGVALWMTPGGNITH
jgi:hypothetical protein